MLLLKKHLRLQHLSTIDPAIQFTSTRLKKKLNRNGQKQTKKHKCITADINAEWQHAAHSTDQQTSLCCLASHTKEPIPQRKMLKNFFGKKSRVWAVSRKKGQDKKSKRSR